MSKSPRLMVEGSSTRTLPRIITLSNEGERLTKLPSLLAGEGDIHHLLVRVPTSDAEKHSDDASVRHGTLSKHHADGFVEERGGQSLVANHVCIIPDGGSEVNDFLEIFPHPMQQLRTGTRRRK